MSTSTTPTSPRADLISDPIAPQALEDLCAAVGARWVSDEPHILDSYAAQPFHKVETGVWIHRPVAVVLPSSTDEVQAVVQVCNRHHLKFKAFSTGWGAHAGAGFEGVVQIDLRRMNRILELDVANRTIVVEPYVTCAQIQAELMPHGLNLHIHGAGSNCSPLANATSHMGMGFSSISMGYSPRNLMGIEWVLPTGELVQVGSFGSGAGWCCPDGPGPSLRGAIRGFAGADGGLGVFTRVALKLYPWSGPATVEVTGTSIDQLDVEIPEGNGAFLCIFGDMDHYADALYALGEAEIGYAQFKVATGLTLAINQPELFRQVRDDPALREQTRAFANQFVILLQGNSQAHYDYQVGVLTDLVTEHGGMVQDATQMIGTGPGGLWWAVIRNAIAPGMFRPTGNFYSSMGGDEAIANALRQATEGEQLKEQFIAEGACADDLADNAHTLLYENGLYAHTEELVMYDHRDREMNEKLRGLSDTVMHSIVERTLGGGGFSFFAGAYAHDYLGPHMENYHVWQRRLKTALDPEDLSDSKYFINSEGVEAAGHG
jgi:glycolate oxidase